MLRQSCSHAEAALRNVVALGQACRSLATAAASIPALHSPAAEHHMQIAVQPSLCVLAHRLPRKAARLPLGTYVIQRHRRRCRAVGILMLRLVCGRHGWCGGAKISGAEAAGWAEQQHATRTACMSHANYAACKSSKQHAIRSMQVLQRAIRAACLSCSMEFGSGYQSRCQGAGASHCRQVPSVNSSSCMSLGMGLPSRLRCASILHSAGRERVGLMPLHSTGTAQQAQHAWQA